jgi:hypothetical protein
MTDRLGGLIVTFNQDYREDDAEDIIKAISMVKGVAEVSPIVTDASDHINRTQIRLEIADKVYSALHDIFYGQVKKST